MMSTDKGYWIIDSDVYGEKLKEAIMKGDIDTIVKMPGVVRIVGTDVLKNEVVNYLLDIQRWEADWILDPESWATADGLPKLTEPLYNRWVELQTRRNKLRDAILETMPDHPYVKNKQEFIKKSEEMDAAGVIKFFGVSKEGA